MPRTPRRLDLMILVAALAIGLAWSRFLASLPESFANPMDLYGVGSPQPGHWTLRVSKHVKDDADWWAPFYFLLRPSEPGIAVVVALTILALSGRWRAEKSAIDRLGRCVGVYWVGALLLSWFGGES